jgi:hypothetical protein
VVAVDVSKRLGGYAELEAADSRKWAGLAADLVGRVEEGFGVARDSATEKLNSGPASGEDMTSSSEATESGRMLTVWESFYNIIFRPKFTYKIRVVFESVSFYAFKCLEIIEFSAEWSDRHW